jgi:hypothetical protein
MKGLFVFLILFVFCDGLLFSLDDIVVEKHYTKDELALFTNLEVYAKIVIKSRVILVYKTRGEGVSDLIYNVKRIILLEDDNGNFLDSWGLIIPGNIDYCTLVTIQSIIMQVQFSGEGMPILCLMYVDEFSDKFTFFPAVHKFIGDICLSENKIYFSVEFGGDSIYRIDIATGETFNYSGYFPNIGLYEIITDEKKTVVFIDNNKQYFLQGDRILLADKQYVVISDKKRLSDFLIKK